MATNPKAVMVIYGHDSEANAALFDWLRAIGLQPREWSQLVRATGSASPFIGDVLEKAFQRVQAVVAFFTPDEFVTSAADRDPGKGRFQARPNVLIEAGMAFITHPTRTIIVVLGTQELPSDLAGRHYIRLTHNAVEPLRELAVRLEDAKCGIDITGSHWLDPSRFPDRTATTSPSNGRNSATQTQPTNEPLTLAHQGTQTRPEVQRAQADTDARQVTVRIDAKSGPNFTHQITVRAPITYPIKQVEGQISWQTNSGLGMTGFGFSGDPPRTDDHHRRYTFRASISPQIRAPEPIIRFVDLHGNRYYQFREHTQRFPPSTDWNQAANAIDQWLRTGPISN